jgi:hypothetical protein
MKHDLESIKLAYRLIWHIQQERNIHRLKTIIRERCDVTEKQHLFSMVVEMILSIFYQEIT